MFAYSNLTVGADPEFFFSDMKNKLISSIGIVGGSKEAPKPIDNYGHFIQEDNVSVEFNIPPCSTSDQFVDSIHYVLKHVYDNYAVPNQLELQIIPSGIFTDDQLEAPAAKVFGCEPDFNAWTGNMNTRPEAGHGGRMRTCGGHIHVGYSNPTPDDQKAIVRAMDMFIGLPSVLMDEDNERRTMYGKAGAYRPKSYGAEYRTVSNFWIRSRELTKWAFEQTIRAVEFCRNPDNVALLNSVKVESYINRAINSGNKTQAEALCKLYGAVVL